MMTSEEAHNAARAELSRYFREHGVFPSELEMDIELLWLVLDYCRNNRIPLQFVPSNRPKPNYAFYGVRITPAQDLTVVGTQQMRCIG